MKTYALYGIDKYNHDRLLCVVQAADIREAARKFGGEAKAPTTVSGNSRFRLHVAGGHECAVFTRGNCTAEIVAQAERATAASPADADTVGGMQYGFANIYKELLIGSVPSIG